MAKAVQRSVSWVKKWCLRLDQAGPAVEAVLHGLPRGRRTPPAGFSEAVIKRVLSIRDEPPEGLQRTPGPETILYDLNRDEGLKAAGERLPRSSSTIWKILDDNQRIERVGPRQRQPVERPEPLHHWQIDGRPFGRLVNTSQDVTHHQGWVSSPWRRRQPSAPSLVSFQGT